MSEPATLGYVLGQYKLNAVCLDCGRCVELDVPELIVRILVDVDICVLILDTLANTL